MKRGRELGKLPPDAAAAELCRRPCARKTHFWRGFLGRYAFLLGAGKW